MRVKGRTTLTTYAAGAPMVCQPLNRSYLTHNDTLLNPSETGSYAPVMPEVRPGDVLTLHIPAGALTIQVDRVREDEYDGQPQTVIQGGGSWDGAYNALAQGASGVGDFYMCLYDTTPVHTSAWPGWSIPLCIYQTARLIATNAHYRAQDERAEPVAMDERIRTAIEDLLPQASSNW